MDRQTDGVTDRHDQVRNYIVQRCGIVICKNRIVFYLLGYTV